MGATAEAVDLATMLFFIPKPLRRLLYLAVLLGVLAVADIWVKTWAEGKVEELAESRLEGVAGVDVSFRGFPFVGRLVVLGEIDGMEVRFDEVVQQQLRFAQTGFELSGIAIDRGAFISDRDVDLTDIDSGTVFAEITQEEISRVVGTTVVFEPGLAKITVAGQTAQASVAVRDGTLVLVPLNGTEIGVPIPTSDALPCAAQGTVLKGRIRVSCSVDTIPAVLVQAASAAVLGRPF